MKNATRWLINLAACGALLLHATTAEAQRPSPKVTHSPYECVVVSIYAPTEGGATYFGGSMTSMEASLACPLILGPNVQSSTDLAVVYVWVIDNDAAYDIDAYVCFRTFGDAEVHCGPPASTSGASLNMQGLSVTPPPATTEWLSAWLQINGAAGMRKVILGYAQAS